MSIDWNEVRTEALASAAGVLGSAWKTVSAGAAAQIGALVEVAQEIESAAEANPPAITQAEYASLKLSQQRALEGVLKAYEGIGIVVAHQAAAAVWQVVEAALSTVLKISIGL